MKLTHTHRHFSHDPHTTTQLGCGWGNLGRVPVLLELERGKGTAQVTQLLHGRARILIKSSEPTLKAFSSITQPFFRGHPFCPTRK